MVNNKVYVGQTYDVKYRWSHHKSDLTHHRHHNIHLQSAWDKYFSNVSYANDIIICQYDKHFNLIKEWFRHELRDQNYNLKAIISMCNRNSDQKIYMDSIWAYKGDSVTDGYFGNGLYYQYKRKTKRVNMKLTKDGEIIKTFDGIIDACKYLNRPKKFIGNICSAIRLNQHAGGYYWEYAN